MRWFLTDKREKGDDCRNWANPLKYKRFLGLWLLIGIGDVVSHLQQVAGSRPAATTMRNQQIASQVSLPKYNLDTRIGVC